MEYVPGTNTEQKNFINVYDFKKSNTTDDPKNKYIINSQELNYTSNVEIDQEYNNDHLQMDTDDKERNYLGCEILAEKIEL